MSGRYPYGQQRHRKYYLKSDVIPIPTHMFLGIEGFSMPAAPAKKGAKQDARHDANIKRLPDDVYEAILELLPGGQTDAYM